MGGGTVATADREPVVAADRFCVSCGRPASPGAQFCSGCGERYAAPSTSSSEPPGLPAIIPAGLSPNPEERRGGVDVLTPADEHLTGTGSVDTTAVPTPSAKTADQTSPVDPRGIAPPGQGTAEPGRREAPTALVLDRNCLSLMCEPVE